MSFGKVVSYTLFRISSSIAPYNRKPLFSFSRKKNLNKKGIKVGAIPIHHYEEYAILMKNLGQQIFP
jgi:hypothetical protein